jgi:hypothetical protein
VVFTFRKKVATEAISRILMLQVFLQNTTTFHNCSNYVTHSAHDQSLLQAWDAITKEVVHAANLVLPVDSIVFDIQLMGIAEYINYAELQPSNVKNAYNIFFGNTASSVKTFTSGLTNQPITTLFDDSITIASKDATRDYSSFTSVNPHDTVKPLLQGIERKLNALTKNLLC